MTTFHRAHEMDRETVTVVFANTEVDFAAAKGKGTVTVAFANADVELRAA